MPAMAVARTMPWPCQKCWRYIICQRCSTRVGSSPTTSSARSCDGPDDAARVPFERRLAPAEQAVLVGEDLDEDPVPHPGVADVRFDPGDLHGRHVTRSGGGGKANGGDFSDRGRDKWPRKLLLHRRESACWRRAPRRATIRSMRVIFTGPREKVELVLAKGKDMYERQTPLDQGPRREARDRPGDVAATRGPGRARPPSASAGAPADSWQLAQHGGHASTVFGEISRRSAISLYM